MDPLSISASVVGLLAAGAQVIGLINQIRDAPQSLNDIKDEVVNLNIIIRGLEKFVEKTSNIKPARAALIPVQDVVAIVTKTVLVYGDLAGVVKSWSTDNTLKAKTKIALGRGDAAAALRLVNQLQRHKTSLSLVLQIIQCGSDLEAQEVSEALQARTDQELEENDELAKRLQDIELPPGTIQALDDSRAASPIDAQELKENEKDAADSLPEPHIEEQNEKSSMLEVDEALLISFEEVLAASRAYMRTRNLESDAVSCASTTRSHGWSMLSGISSSQVSRIGVICLPLFAPEVERFLDLAFPKRGPVAFQGTVSMRQKLLKQVNDFQAQCAPDISGGFIGDDPFHWQITLFGPHDTPYQGGVFFLAMHFPVDYPFKQPRVYFTTRICHPNVSSTGQISNVVRANNWTPAWTPAKLMLSIQSLIKYPDLTDVLSNDVAYEYKNDRARFEARAREWTRKYAI